jgi:tetraacyldisaccharide 4'-kinase
MPEASGLQRWIEQTWYGTRAPWFLLPFSVLYSLVMRIRRAAYHRGLLRSWHPGVPVLVVGNITVGGTGKTPFTLWLAQRLIKAGIKVGIATRGYGGAIADATLVTRAHTAAEVGDEAVLLARGAGCPVCVGAKRSQAADVLVAAGCQLIICDDGLQHLALRRDLEIVVMDGARGLGNGALLPAGPLREAAARLDDVDMIVVNGDVRAPLPASRAPFAIMQLLPIGVQGLAGQGLQPLAQWQGRMVHAVAGIGNPQRFFDLLRAAGLQLQEHVFADHHAYMATDLGFGDDVPILMTEKDAVKCGSFATQQMWYLPVEAGLPDADATRILQLVHRALSHGA